MAMAMDVLGVPSISLNAFQVQMHTTSTYGNARLKRIDTERIIHELESKKIVIITGFQGVNKYDDFTTLGRGGSDTTAVALAAALRADMCEIYTDVDGVYTADPRIVTKARKLPEITYDEMLDLATLGAGVLHNRSVEMAKKYNVDLEVLSSLEKKPGTKVKEVCSVEKMLIRGVAKNANVARISVIGVADRPGSAFKIFSVLGKKDINVDIIIQSLGRDDQQEISFTVAKDVAMEAVSLLQEAKAALGVREIECDMNVCEVSIVGSGMLHNSGVAQTMFQALADSNINIQMISTSEIKISVLIDEASGEKAVQAVHNAFFG
jgi:aspartate kinase